MRLFGRVAVSGRGGGGGGRARRSAFWRAGPSGGSSLTWVMLAVRLHEGSLLDLVLRSRHAPDNDDDRGTTAARGRVCSRVHPPLPLVMVKVVLLLKALRPNLGEVAAPVGRAAASSPGASLIR